MGVLVQVQYSRFAIDESPHCVWDYDLRMVTKVFLDTFDPEYFDYLAATHEEAIDGDNVRRAATALRATYCHAMETLFAFLIAAFQAPDCMPGWIQRYTLGQLRTLVDKINRGRPIHSKIRLVEARWSAFSECVHRCLTLDDKDKEQRIKKGFAGFWGQLAGDFLADDVRAEYNSIKHGLRIGSGGSAIYVGIEETPGVACPPEQMTCVGGSEFGSSFYVAEPLNGTKDNLWLRRASTNWDPPALAGRIRIISMSLRNIASFLRIGHGGDPTRVKFSWPADLDAFDKVWHGPSLRSSSFGTAISDKIQPLAAEEILAVYTRDEDVTTTELGGADCGPKCREAGANPVWPGDFPPFPSR